MTFFLIHLSNTKIAIFDEMKKVKLFLIVLALASCTPTPREDFSKLTCEELSQRMDQKHENIQTQETLDGLQGLFSALGGGGSQYHKNNGVTEAKLDLMRLENASYAKQCHLKSAPQIGGPLLIDGKPVHGTEGSGAVVGKK